MKQWPNAQQVDFMVTSPELSYSEQWNDMVPKETFINVLVGDLQRIRELPKRGFQIEQTIPDEVWAAYERVVKAGYGDYLIDF